jgi:hypothetical protein
MRGGLLINLNVKIPKERPSKLIPINLYFRYIISALPPRLLRALRGVDFAFL